MPSPFPGMDPYLEEPGLWPDVHHEFISEMRAELSRQLRPRYFVRVEDRVYVTDDNDPGLAVIIPVVRVTRSTREERMALTRPQSGGGAVADEVKPIEVIDAEFPVIHEARLEVIDRAERQVVAVVELLSPTNKVYGSRGREQYVRKRQEILLSPSHFVEIDLLRGGEPIRVDAELPPHHYIAQVSRAERRPKWTVWPILLTDRLPTIDIPLKGNDPDARLDLQQVLNTSYERAAYDIDIDYTRPPVPPLPGEYATWAEKLVAAATR